MFGGALGSFGVVPAAELRLSTPRVRRLNDRYTTIGGRGEAAFVFATASFRSVTRTHASPCYRSGPLLNPNLSNTAAAAALRSAICVPMDYVQHPKTYNNFPKTKWFAMFVTDGTHPVTIFRFSSRRPSTHICRPYSVNIVAQKSRYQPSNTCARRLPEEHKHGLDNTFAGAVVPPARQPEGRRRPAVGAQDAQAQ